MSTLPGAEHQRAATVTGDALDHLKQIDIDGMEIHQLLGILAVTAPAAVISAVRDIVALRDQRRTRAGRVTR